jgi:hypothetical protein
MAKAKTKSAKSATTKSQTPKSPPTKSESVGSRYGGWIAAYGVVALLTSLFQVWIRLPLCEGAGACAFSLLKGLIWSLIWPTYWVVYLLSHSPWKALQGSLGLIG